MKYNHLLQSMLYSAVLIVPAAGANAASVSMSDSATSYSCATFSTIAFDAAGNATVNCSGYVTGGVPIPSTTPPTTPPTTPGAANDPGYGTGLWLPAGTTNLFVVDQMNTGGVGNVDYIPGCVNSVTAEISSSSCALQWSQTSGNSTITMAQGNVLSIRFPSKNTLSLNGGNFGLSARNGLNTPHAFSMWLTSDPTASYENTPELCRNWMFGKKTQNVQTGKYGCPVSPGKLYYLNIRIDDTCSGQDCTFALTEETNDFKY